MTKTVQHKIYIGLNDSQAKGVYVCEEALIEMVSSFFENRKIGYSIDFAEGGFLYEDGNYITENTVVITLIGEQNIDVIKLSKTLSMFMNQECLMITKTYCDVGYR